MTRSQTVFLMAIAAMAIWLVAFIWPDGDGEQKNSPPWYAIPSVVNPEQDFWDLSDRERLALGLPEGTVLLLLARQLTQISRDPDAGYEKRALALKWRGYIRIQRGEHADAAADLLEASRRRPEDYSTFMLLSRSRREDGRCREALPAATRAVELAPAFYMPLEERAAVLECLGRDEAMIADLETAISAVEQTREPTSSLFQIIGWIYDLDWNGKVDFLSGRMRFQICETHWKNEHFDRARNLCQGDPLFKALGDGSVEAWLDAGRGRLDVDDVWGAAAAFDRAVSRAEASGHPNALAYYYRGYTYAEFAELSKSIRDYELALAAGPASPETRTWIIDRIAEMKEYIVEIE